MKQKSDIHTLNRVNLYEQVADYLEQQILDPDQAFWQAGEQLPSEQELANSFGVSRNVVREAIKLLKERGLTEPRNGVGVYVTRPEPQKLSELIYRFVLMNKIDIVAIYDTRILLEVHSAEMAAQCCTDEQLEQMHQLLDRMNDRTISVNERRETDYLFHVAIAQAAGNPMNEILISALKDVFIAMIEKGIFNHGGIEDACRRHERIYQALAAHNPQEAKEAMREHLEFSQKQVIAYISREEE